MLPRTVLPLFLLGCLSSARADEPAAGQREPLITAQAIRALTPKQANEARPVVIAGVVTDSGSAERGFHIQDTTAGIFIQPTPLASGLQLGDRVEVEGLTDAGRFTPCIVARKLKRLGTAPLPESLPFDLTINDSQWFDGQWVHVWAIIQTARSEAGLTYIDVYNAHGRATLVIPGEEWTTTARRFRNEPLAVRGVCVGTFENRRVSDVPRIRVPELPKSIGLTTTRNGRAGAALLAIDELHRVTPQPHPPGIERARITGVVTATPLPNLLMVQDRAAGAAVWTDMPSGFPIGARIEAYGLLHRLGPRLTLTQSYVTRLGDTEVPQPVPATVAELAGGLRDAVRVRVEGRLEGFRPLGGWTAIILTGDGMRFAAYLAGTPEENGLNCKLEIGARVGLVGVPADVSPDRKPPEAPGLFLQSGNAVTVLEPPAPPQQTGAAETSALSARAAYMFGGVATLGLLGGGWLLALRGRTRRAIEDAKRQAEEKTRLERQLRQASKFEAVGRLAGGIAHDFNNLLTVINGCAELLEEEAARDGGRFSDLTGDIRKAGERAAALTGQLLTYSRKRDIVIQAIDLNAVVMDTLRLLGRVIGESIRIESHLAADLPPVRGEPGLLHQVMMNLAVNAKDAMPDGGTLTLTTALVTDSGPGTDGPAAGRQCVRLTVADTGVGMSEEVKARLFEPFFTTKAVGSGTGLGLATVSGIIQLLRGNITVDSKVGAGARFQIDLRIHGQPSSEPDFALPTPFPPTSRISTPQLTGKTILVVEDNEMVRATIVAGLRGEGATVLSANHPDDALLLLATHTGAVDALVTDVVMPGMSGPALVERTRDSRPDMRVVFMSGYTPEEVSRQGLCEDEVEFLQKPFTPDNLIRRLLRVLGRDVKPAART